MAASEEEAERQLGALTQTIRDHRNEPAWQRVNEVLDLIQSEIDEGRPIMRSVKVKESDGQDRITGQDRSRTQSSASLVGSEPYSSSEALDMTAEALALAFVSPVKMASRLLDTVARFGSIDGEREAEIVIKIAGRGDQEKREPKIELTRNNIARARQSLRPLAGNLNSLLKELDLKRRPLLIAFENEEDADGDRG
ncbi:hypothetical protein [Nisaea sp.]|uniref:hypothetical protein n=1 Tax=Nisaea sp. TaxID=2024842 RepID=UPI002B2745F2|nr:hypothetical protein [Nisaea sp.]